MPANTDINQRLFRIRKKLLSRGAQLGDCLTEEEVESFEDEHAIILPDVYREFLLVIGNGGEGPPYYGCPKLGHAADGMTPDEQFDWTALPEIAEPFPFTTHWIWEEGNESDEGSQEEINHGSLCIGDDGCGQFWHLIVTGPERGNVWYFCGGGITPTIPNRDFLQWYEDWLDGADNWFE